MTKLYCSEAYGWKTNLSRHDPTPTSKANLNHTKVQLTRISQDHFYPSAVAKKASDQIPKSAANLIPTLANLVNMQSYVKRQNLNSPSHLDSLKAWMALIIYHTQQQWHPNSCKSKSDVQSCTVSCYLLRISHGLEKEGLWIMPGLWWPRVAFC